MTRNQLLPVAFVVVLLGLGAAGSQCRGVPDPVPIEDTASCNAACEHVRDAGCTIGESTAEGMPCEIWCAETQGDGFPLRPSCWLTVETLTAPDCPEIEAACFGH